METNFLDLTTNIGMLILYSILIGSISFLLIGISDILVDVIKVRIKKTPWLNQNYEYDQRNFYYQDGILAIGMQDFKEAINCFSESLILDNQFALALYARGSIYQKIGDYEKAIKDYHIYLEIKPDDSKVLNNLAMAYFSSGNLRQAKVIIEQAINQDPYLKEAYHNRGLIALHQKDIQNAIMNFEKAMEVPPKELTDSIPLAFVDILNRNYENAITKLNKIEQKIQTEEDSLLMVVEENFATIDILYYRGYCYYKLGNDHQAQKNFAMADAVLPHQPLLRYEDLIEEKIFC